MRVVPSAMAARASSRTSDSAQPPPTQPWTLRPFSSMRAFEPGLAEAEPTTRITVATAKGRRFSMYSCRILVKWLSMGYVSVAPDRPACSRRAA